MIRILTGPNTYLLQSKSSQLKARYVEQYGAIGLETLDGDEISFERMQEALTSLPFLAPKKLVVLKSPSSNKEFTEKYEQLLRAVPDSTDLVLIEPKLDKRTGYYKYLKKLEGFEEFSELDESKLTNWLQSYARQQGGVISPASARYLISRTGTDQLKLKQEADKLMLYSQEVTRETVDLLTAASPSSTIFELLDAAFSGNKERLLKIYEEQRSLKVDPMQIIAMLGWQFHILAIVMHAGSKNDREIASEARISPFVVQKTRAISKKLTVLRLRQLLQELVELDTRLKTSKLSADDALQAYLLTLAH